MAEAFASGKGRTRKLLQAVSDPTDGRGSKAKRLALLGAGKADLAVGRGDLEMPGRCSEDPSPSCARRNSLAVWRLRTWTGKELPKENKPAPEKLRGSRIRRGTGLGVIGRTPAKRLVAAGHFERLRRGGGTRCGYGVIYFILKTPIGTPTKFQEELARDATFGFESLGGVGLARQQNPPPTPSPRLPGREASPEVFSRSRHSASHFALKHPTLFPL